MNPSVKTNDRPWVPIGIALIAGAVIAATDSFAFGGEVSPIVIVGALLIVAGVAGAIWGSRAALSAVIVWAWLPLAHVVKHLCGLPDTLHPNTYASILKLGLFTLAITAIGFALGLGCRRLAGASATARA